MGKANRRKRRQAAAQSKRGQAWAEQWTEQEQARRAARAATKPKADPNWFQRQKVGTQVLVVLGAVVAAVGGHFVLWGSVFPVLGEAVGRVPVVSTVVGWLFGGGAFMAWGVVGVNHATAKPGTKAGLQVVAWSWTVVAVMLFPTEYANDVSLPVDFWAGVYAGAYGVIMSPLALIVAGLGWWLLVNKLFGYKKELGHQAFGWICVGYATLLLIWGSTLLRM
ncbi:hypothetical protein ALI22I_19335 [Saccharothrix sp. ALI-22-I]|uniref:hypothetical protein n=1 Tax=Saccharothrix sp. ALI-22-I TaxID=1933778 RepID=UPI00097C2D07|nr:hypothetical protein [Saccharothrix sp. ALI-22-I]ONI88502.1 hypothetical protein ALI22I_19335 [Saccharothrix sp. ALI-22-I]